MSTNELANNKKMELTFDQILVANVKIVNLEIKIKREADCLNVETQKVLLVEI